MLMLNEQPYLSGAAGYVDVKESLWMSKLRCICRH